MKRKPVAKLARSGAPKKSIFGCMSGKIWQTGDIEAPVLPPISEWDMVKYRWAAQFGPERKPPTGRGSRRAGRKS